MLQCISQPGVLPVSSSLRLLPLYILALLKSPAFTPRYWILDPASGTIIIKLRLQEPSLLIRIRNSLILPLRRLSPVPYPYL
jgi:hypothetical protein